MPSGVLKMRSANSVEEIDEMLGQVTVWFLALLLVLAPGALSGVKGCLGGIAKLPVSFVESKWLCFR